jgi:multiple sugar transport system permease protein
MEDNLMDMESIHPTKSPSNATLTLPPAPGWHLPSMKIQTVRRFLFIVLVAPAFLLRLTTAAYPMLQTVYLSFTNLDLMKNTSAFIGLDNFANLPDNFGVQGSLWFTIAFVLISTVLDLTVGMMVAQLLNIDFRGRNFARVINLIPWAIPTIVAGYGFRWLLDEQFGLITSWIFQLSGVHAAIFISAFWAQVTVILVFAWKNAPFVAIVMLAGLQGVPQDIYEASKLDGANAWQRFWWITLPMIMPLTVTMVLFWMVWSLANFDLVYGLTQGGPGVATSVLALQIFREGIMFFKFGFASAISVILLILVAVIGVVGLWVYRKVEVTY